MTAGMIVRIIGLILVILFFVPTTLVTCDHTEARISPSSVATGTCSVGITGNSESFEKEDMEGSYPIFYLMLVLSAVLIILGCNLPQAGIVVTGANAIMLVAMHLTIAHEVDAEFYGAADTKITWAFVAYLLCCVIAIVLLFMEISYLKQEQNRLYPQDGGWGKEV